jgi:hypothetical protein
MEVMTSAESVRSALSTAESDLYRRRAAMLDDVLLVSRMRFTYSRVCSTPLIQSVGWVGQCGIFRKFRETGCGHRSFEDGSLVIVQESIPSLAFHAAMIPRGRLTFDR